MKTFLWTAITLTEILSRAAAQCRCSRYLCRSGENEYSYTIEEMPSQEIIQCILSNKAYNPRGACRYCSSCDGSLCTCQTSGTCESFLPRAAAVVCFALGLLLLVITVRSTWKWAQRTVLVRVRPDELPENQVRPEVPMKVWERNPRVSVLLPCVGAVLFLIVGVVVWVSPDLINQSQGSP